MRHIRRTAAALAIAALSTSAFADDHSLTHWTYEGEEGPAHWGSLSSDFAACSKGMQQSPVNLTEAHAAENEPLALDWKPFAPRVVNNGHTIQAVAADGNNVTRLAGKAYYLQQVHFHHPSEHTIDGRRAPMEAHFVSKGEDGKLLVLGVMIDEGNVNDELGKLWDAAPQRAGEAPAKASVDFAKLVPSASKFYRYAGSLTTPPCSETVQWVVFSEPVTASKEQIETFATLYPDNSRPVQALHARTIVLGR